VTQVKEVGRGDKDKPWFTTPEARMLRALGTLGWDLGDLWGVAWGTVDPAPYTKHIRDLYEKLSMTPGPDKRVQVECRLLWWAPPLAWYDATLDAPESPIEDPKALPNGYPYTAPERRREQGGQERGGTYHGRPITPENRKTILRLVMSGHTIPEIQELVPDVSRGSIQDVRLSIPDEVRPVVQVSRYGVRKVFNGRYNESMYGGA
jgi:hypothetical protein